MNISAYFPDAIEFEELLKSIHFASGNEKQLLKKQIINSSYLKIIRESQSMSEWQEDAPVRAVTYINKLKKDFFFNISICGIYDEEDVPKENHMPYHRHNYLEMIFVLEGRYLQTINGCDYTYKKGDICLMNPNVLHRDGISGPDDRVLFVCLGQNYVNKELAEAFTPHEKLHRFMEFQLGKNTVQYVIFSPKDEISAEQVMEQILKENTEKEPGHHTVIKGLLVRLFYRLVADGNYGVCHQSKKEIEEGLITEITRYMEEHLTDISRAETAKYFHFNPDYLNRMLVRSIGKTYSEYKKELCLKEAARRLEQTEESVNCIIRELGFSNKGYFNRIFKEHFGTLPGEYRKQV